MRKFLRIMLGVVPTAFIIVALPFILGFFSKDIGPIDDQDLLYTPRKVAEKNNAYYDLAKIEESEDLEKENLAYFEAATQKLDYQHPSYADLSTTNFVNIVNSPSTQIIPITRLNVTEAMRLAKQGDEQQALDKLFHMLALAETMQKAEGTLIQGLITITLEKLTLEGIQDIAQNSNLPKGVSANYAERLAKYKDAHLEEAFKGEYLLFVAVLNEVSEGTKTLGEPMPSWLETVSQWAPQFYIHPNRTKQIAAENLRKGIALVNTPCNELKITNNETNDEIEKTAPDSPLALYITKNAVGKMLYDAMAIRPEGANQKRCEIEKLFMETEKILTPSL